MIPFISFYICITFISIWAISYLSFLSMKIKENMSNSDNLNEALSTVENLRKGNITNFQESVKEIKEIFKKEKKILQKSKRQGLLISIAYLALIVIAYFNSWYLLDKYSFDITHLKIITAKIINLLVIQQGLFVIAGFIFKFKLNSNIKKSIKEFDIPKSNNYSNELSKIQNTLMMVMFYYCTLYFILFHIFYLLV